MGHKAYSFKVHVETYKTLSVCSHPGRQAPAETGQREVHKFRMLPEKQDPIRPPFVVSI